MDRNTPGTNQRNPISTSTTLLNSITRLESFLMFVEGEIAKDDDCNLTDVDALIVASRREVRELCITLDSAIKSGELQ